jgi:hypothetical protein
MKILQLFYRFPQPHKDEVAMAYFKDSKIYKQTGVWSLPRRHSIHRSILLKITCATAPEKD